MVDQNSESEYHNNNILGVMIGVLVGGLVGALTMLLLAPQSGKNTRLQIQQKAIQLRNRTTGMMDEALAEVRSDRDKIVIGGQAKIKELAQHGREIAVEQLDRLSEAAQAGKQAIQNA